MRYPWENPQSEDERQYWAFFDPETGEDQSEFSIAEFYEELDEEEDEDED